jgi:hypothetical protein
VKLHRIEVVGPQAPQALFHSGSNVLASEDVLARPGSFIRANRAPALACEHELVAP